MSLKNAFTKMGLLEDTEITPKTTKKVATETKAPVVHHEVEVSAPTVEVDSSISEMLEQSLQENKLAGFDYLKFVSAVEEMKTYSTPEDARYKMAFSTAKQLGVNKDSLTKSGQHYLDVLTQDEKDFDADCDQYAKKEIQGRTTKIADLEKRIETLTSDLSEAKEEYEKLNGEVQEKQQTLDTRKEAFKNALQSFVSTIEANIEKIN